VSRRPRPARKLSSPAPSLAFATRLGQEQAKLRLARPSRRTGSGMPTSSPAPTASAKRLLAQESAKALLCAARASAPAGCARIAGSLRMTATPTSCSSSRRRQPRHQIKQVQDLIHTLSLMPVQGDRRVAILRDADALTEEAPTRF